MRRTKEEQIWITHPDRLAKLPPPEAPRVWRRRRRQKPPDYPRQQNSRSQLTRIRACTCWICKRPPELLDLQDNRMSGGEGGTLTAA
jgi:hypothetical protein